MNKVLVNVTCVALRESYDAFIPKSITIGEAATLLGHCMEEATNQRYVASGTELLCTRNGGQLLNSRTIVGESGLKNGDGLLLF